MVEGAQMKNGGHSHPMQHGLVVQYHWAKILAGEMWHDHAVTKSSFCMLDCSRFFVEFVGCALVGDCVWAILEAI